MNEHSEFQQLADRALSALQWHERHRQRVLHALNEERRPILMKKKLTGLIALAVVLCLMTGTALAATLVYSQRYEKAARADALLAAKYGVTADLLSFFTRTAQGDIFRYQGVPEFHGMPGDYLVDLSAGEVKWLFDGPSAAGWDAEKLREVLARCTEPDGYSLAAAEAAEEAAAIGLLLPALAMPSDAELAALLAQSAQREEQALSLARISLEEAEALARSAIQAQYGLTDAQMQQLEFVPESTLYTVDGETPVVQPYFWLSQRDDCWTEKDGIYIVVVNVQDGAIESTHYDSGLFGNG